MLALTWYIISVSYTHLDVYKRQVSELTVMESHLIGLLMSPYRHLAAFPNSIGNLSNECQNHGRANEIDRETGKSQHE